jgi:ATP-dependent Clp protease adapter protein ClpS
MQILLEEIRNTIGRNVKIKIIDDNYHSFSFVQKMLMDVFDMNTGVAYSKTYEIHRYGHTIAIICPHDEAKKYTDKIERCVEFSPKFGNLGPINAIIERFDDE